MSVQNDTSLVQYTGNNSTDVAYPITFPYALDSDLRVTVTNSLGVNTELAKDIGFIVNPVVGPNGASIFTVAPYDNTNQVTIYRSVAATQLTVYVENAPFPAASHEAALDKLTYLIQQNARSIGNTLRLPATSLELDPITALNNSVIGLDPDGKPITYGPSDLLTFLSLMAPVLNSPTRTFANAGQRAAAVPDFVGQIGSQQDTGALYISTGLVAGNWSAVLSGTSYANSAYIIVRTTAVATDNGTALIAAYNAAKLLTPSGSALASTNRAVVIVPPGEYDLGTSRLQLNTQFIDIVGMTTDRKAQYIHSITATSNQGTVEQTANDVRIENLYLANFCSDDASTSNATAAAYFPSSDLSSARLKNVEFFTSSTTTGPYPTRAFITYSGRYDECYAAGVLFGGASAGTGAAIASGTFRRCEGGAYSFGGGGANCICSGTFYDCLGGSDSFGGRGGNVSATAIILNSRKTGTNLTDNTTLAAGAIVSNFQDPSGVRYFPYAPVDSGAVVQKLYAEYTANASITTAIPVNDSIPTKSQGTQILSVAITPKFANSRIIVTFQGFGAGGNIVAILLKDTITNALAANSSVPYNSNNPAHMGLTYQDSPGSIAPITYKINVGSSSMRMNGTGSARLFGGAGRATLTVEEIKV